MESIVSQGYPNLEYIVIDNLSTDHSLEIIEKYKHSLHYFISEKDSGHGNALNKGFSHSSGEIMAWLNSDDKYMPWTLQTVASIFSEHPDVNWIVGTNGLWNDKGALVSAQNIYKNIHDYLRGDFQWIQQESVFWRRSLWERAGGFINENFKLMVDGELWTRFFQLDRLYNVHCLLSGYRMHNSNRARDNYQAVLEEMYKAIGIMELEVKKNISSYPDDYLIITYDNNLSKWVKTVV